MVSAKGGKKKKDKWNGGVLERRNRRLKLEKEREVVLAVGEKDEVKLMVFHIYKDKEMLVR